MCTCSRKFSDYSLGLFFLFLVGDRTNEIREKNSSLKKYLENNIAKSKVCSFQVSRAPDNLQITRDRPSIHFPSKLRATLVHAVFFFFFTQNSGRENLVVPDSPTVLLCKLSNQLKMYNLRHYLFADTYLPVEKNKLISN